MGVDLERTKENESSLFERETKQKKRIKERNRKLAHGRELPGNPISIELSV